MTPAEQIRAIREKTGLDKTAFSKIIGVPIRTLEDWEAGRRIPKPYMIVWMKSYIKDEIK